MLLDSFANAFDDITWQSLRPWNTGLSYVTPSGLLLERHILNTGWCPFRLHHIFALFPYNVIYYLAYLTKIGTRIADHTRCLNNGMCKGDSIIKGIAFRYRRTSDCDGACLKEGDIPLIACSLTSLDKLQLDVMKAAQGTDYTAITHV